jgi:hypothetical protein
MKRIDYRVGLVLIAVAATCVVGCADHSDMGVRVSSNRPRMSANPGPEESFELILETFRRGIEGVKVGFVARREGGHSMMSGDNKVSHKLIPPTKEGDPYKAIITVESKSSYSLQRTTPAETDRENNKPGNQDSQSGIAGDDPVGIDILDSDLVGKPADAASSTRPSQPVADTTTVARRPQSPVTKSYELQYENGRWALMSELDPETEQGIKNAFDHAFKTQI